MKKVYVIGAGHMLPETIEAIRLAHNIPFDVEIICIQDESEIPGSEALPAKIEPLVKDFTLKPVHYEPIPDTKSKRRGWERPYKYHR